MSEGRWYYFAATVRVYSQEGEQDARETFDDCMIFMDGDVEGLPAWGPFLTLRERVEGAGHADPT